MQIHMVCTTADPSSILRYLNTRSENTVPFKSFNISSTPPKGAMANGAATVFGAAVAHEERRHRL